MHDIENVSWVEQLEVTGPIKSIMGFVDELSLNYDRRVAAMHADYQKDVEEILECYRKEKQDFETLLQQSKDTITELQDEIKALQQTYKTLSIEHKMTVDSLETARLELKQLTQELKSEEELVALAQERIKAANEQIKAELEAKTEQIEHTEVTIEKAPKKIFNRSREFFKQVMEARLSRPIILRAKEEPSLDNAEDRDTFSY